jgi:GntR family transcriptional regulator
MFRIDPASPVPLYAQIERAIRAAIAAGVLRAGDRLPTVRQLAVDLRVNANTVARVYSELERAGVLATQRGVGTTVRDPAAINKSARDRERALRGIADRTLAEAAAVGIPATDVIRHLQQRSRETR